MTDIPTIGDNFPPEPTPIERGAELVAAANRWSAEVPKIADAEQAGRCQAFIDQLRLETEEIEAAQKDERKPHDDAIVAIRAKYRQSLELLGIALSRMKGLASNWLARESGRLTQEVFDRKQTAIRAEEAAAKAREEAARAGATVEAEAAARKAEEDAEAAAALAAKPVKRPQIRGEFSPRAMSLRPTWRAKITDEQKALRHYAKHADIRKAALAAIVKVASKEARDAKDKTKSPPGIQFTCDEQAV